VIADNLVNIQPRHGQSVRPIIPIPLTSQLVGGDLPAGPRAQIRCTEVVDRFAKLAPLERLGQPADIAATVILHTDKDLAE
jgi:hypothetical protein